MRAETPFSIIQTVEYIRTFDSKVMLHFPIHYRYILQFYRDGLDIFNEFSSLIFAWQYKMETTLKIRTEKREFYSVSLAFVYHGSLDKLSYNFLCCIYLCRMPVVELIIAHCNVE